MDILEELGFCKYERDVIRVLLKFQKLDALDIAKYSKVPTNKVYQTLNVLISESVIAYENSVPKVYSLINFDKFVKRKLEQKQNNLDELENEAEKFLLSYSSPQLSEDFWILNDVDSLLLKIEAEYENLQKESIGLIERWVARYSTLKVTRAMIKRGVRVRFLGRFEKKDILVVRKWLNVGIEIGYIDFDVKAGFSVFDSRTVKISILGDKLKSIWAQNESLAVLLKDYYEVLWERAIKVDENFLKKIEKRV